MITKVEIKKFKRYQDLSVTLHECGVSLLVGANNSGRSTFLQALSVWAFCKTIVEFEKGHNCLLRDTPCSGSGINIDDFHPLNIPSFSYLWTNQKYSGSYTLSLCCYWHDGNDEKFLEFSLSLVQERLFIKKSGSNLQANDKIPRIVYVPSFAGIEVNEEFHPLAIRGKLLGKGLSGSVLRNEIMELYNNNQKTRKEKKGDKKRISAKDLDNIRNTDPFEILQKILLEVYKVQLEPQMFNPAFHTYLRINVKKGSIESKRFKPFKGFKPRDIMVEGSGFLQWLSVYTYALSRNIDVLLLDEPDAHLHNSLQVNLFRRLSSIAKQYQKQFIISTHSGELIKAWDSNEILHAQGSSIKYIQHDNDKVRILNNLGSEYCPILDSIKLNKHVLFVENESDVTILKELCDKIGKKWPANITVWPHANSHKERTHIFDYLINEIHGLKAISLNDRDTECPNNITKSLKDKGYNDRITDNECIYYRTWQRHEIENYLFDVEPIARAIAKKNNRPCDQALIDEVREWFRVQHGLVFNANYRSKERKPALDTLFDKDGHEVMNSLDKKYHIKPIHIAREMRSDEVFEDVQTFIDEVIRFCG
jgi:hypothetical protein